MVGRVAWRARSEGGTTTAGKASLLQGLEQLSLSSNQVALHPLGQAGFAVRGANVTLLVDPYLSPEPHRAVPAAFAAGEGAGISYILCTHEHSDHLDGPALRSLLAASPEARVVVPEPLVSLVTELGWDQKRVISAQPGTWITQGNLVIHPVRAAHGVAMEDAYSFGKELSGGSIGMWGT